MKKLFILPAVLIVLSLSSCKKDHVCSCTYTSTAPGYTTSTTEVTVTEARKSDVKRICVKTEETSGGYVYTSDCKLK